MPDSLPLAFFLFLFATTIGGIIGVFVVLRHWQPAAPEDFNAKLAAKVIQTPSVVVGCIAAFTDAEQKWQWLPATAIGIASGLAWEAFTILVDRAVKSAERAAAAGAKKDTEGLSDRLRKAEAVSEGQRQLLTAFRRLADRKSLRLHDAFHRGDRASVGVLRVALTPRDHITEVLLALATYFAQQVRAQHGQGRNVRVGLYAAADGVMAPIRAYDLNNPTYRDEVFRSFQGNRTSFTVATTERPSLIVVCVQQKATLIAEDCVAAADAGHFFFFTEYQRSYLRSMVACYLGGVSGPGGGIMEAALAVDTDAAGFFREADREGLELALREFGTRVKLELLLEAVLTAKGHGNATGTPAQAGETPSHGGRAGGPPAPPASDLPGGA